MEHFIPSISLKNGLHLFFHPCFPKWSQFLHPPSSPLKATVEEDLSGKRSRSERIAQPSTTEPTPTKLKILFSSSWLAFDYVILTSNCIHDFSLFCKMYNKFFFKGHNEINILLFHWFLVVFPLRNPIILAQAIFKRFLFCFWDLYQYFAKICFKISTL